MRRETVIAARSFYPPTLVALLLTGCGGSDNFNLRGKVVRGGEPFTVPKDETVRVTFYEQTADGKMGKNAHIAAYDGATGTFRVVGRDGTGLLAGKYRVAVEHEKKRRDLLK